MPGAPNYFKALSAKTPVAKLAHNPRLLEIKASFFWPVVRALPERGAAVLRRRRAISVL